MLYLAWRYGGDDPYCVYNGLDKEYRPLVGGEPSPPPRPWRVKCFLYACAQQALKDTTEQLQIMAGGSVTRQFKR